MLLPHAGLHIKLCGKFVPKTSTRLIGHAFTREILNILPLVSVFFSSSVPLLGSRLLAFMFSKQQKKKNNDKETTGRQI